MLALSSDVTPFRSRPGQRLHGRSQVSCQASIRPDSIPRLLAQVFTGENWHMIMYSAVSGTSMWACLYFIFLVIFGHYLLLNLFLAGIVRNVVDQHQERRTRESRAVNRRASIQNRSSFRNNDSVRFNDGSSPDR